MTKVMAKAKEAEVCLVCNKTLKDTWYTYEVGAKSVELCLDCENQLRIKMLEQTAGELWCEQVGRHIRRPKKKVAK